MSLNEARLTLNREFEDSEDKTINFILFSLGGELYGAPLLSTREVIRRGVIKPAPYMIPCFKGVINLRGQIVSVVDLRVRFGVSPHANSQDLIMIVDGAKGLLGAIVDDIVSVEKIQKADLEQEVKVQTKIPLDFFFGVAKVKDRLVNIVDIAGCLSAEDWKATKESRAI